MREAGLSPGYMASHGQSQPQSQALRLPDKGTPPAAGGTLLYRDSGNAGEDWVRSPHSQRACSGAEEHSSLPSKLPSFPMPKVVLKLPPPVTKAARLTPGKGRLRQVLGRTRGGQGDRCPGEELGRIWERCTWTRKSPSRCGVWRNSSTYAYADVHPEVHCSNDCGDKKVGATRGKMDKLMSPHNEILYGS